MLKLIITCLVILGTYVACSNMDFFHTQAFTVGNYSVKFLLLALVGMAVLTYKRVK